MSVAEARVQTELFSFSDWLEVKLKADVWVDGITDKLEHDAREAWVFFRPSELIDCKVGRQVLTWGTGDLVFLNDLFPKDWQSYFIGRDQEYLKAPSDAVKVSLFSSNTSLDLVYTPQFDPDRYITGEYVSFWGQGGSEKKGENRLNVARTPDQWFKDDELALRLYHSIDNYEIAVYGYRGFWKRPAGQDESGAAVLPGLDVFGGSFRGQVGPGIGNIEVAWYRSVENTDGGDPLIDNSEIRYLIGYALSIGKDLDISVQYYLEQLMDYEAYTSSFAGNNPRDRQRHVVTIQLTKLLVNQNLELSLSGYVSPSDEDTFLRPRLRGSSGLPRRPPDKGFPKSPRQGRAKHP
jgi:hypothetical protein